MPSTATFRPGDLITSAAMNAIVQRLEAVEAAVKALQAADPDSVAVIISEVQPAATVRVGQEVRVLGRNFGVSAGACRVFIDSVRVDSFGAGTTDSRLVFNVPDLPDIGTTGRVVVLTVRNQTTLVERTMTVLPAQDLTGAVDVTWLSTDPTTVKADAPALFKFKLTSRATLAADYGIEPTIADVADAAVWQKRVRVLDSALHPIPSRTISLPAGETTVFHVSIDPVPSVADGTTFSLYVQARAGDVVGQEQVLKVPVGEESEVPDQKIALIFVPRPVSMVLPTGGGTVADHDLRLKAGAGCKLVLRAEFLATGTFEVVQPEVAARDWSASRITQTTKASYEISDADLNNPEKKASRNLEFAVQAGESAVRPGVMPGSGQVTFRVQRAGSKASRSYVMSVTLLL